MQRYRAFNGKIKEKARVADSGSGASKHLTQDITHCPNCYRMLPVVARASRVKKPIQLARITTTREKCKTSNMICSKQEELMQ